jgi:hypothetical protein
MRNTLLAAALPLMSVACINERAYLDPNEELPTLSTDGQALSFSGGGALSGDIGPVKGFRGTRGVKVEGFDDGACTYVTITGVGENGTGFMYVDLMPRVDELPEGDTGIGADDVTYEGTLVTLHADTDDGVPFDATASGGTVTMVKHASGARELTVHALGDDSAGGEAESIGMFRLR